MNAWSLDSLEGVINGGEKKESLAWIRREKSKQGEGSRKGRPGSGHLPAFVHTSSLSKVRSHEADQTYRVKRDRKRWRSPISHGTYDQSTDTSNLARGHGRFGTSHAIPIHLQAPCSEAPLSRA